MVNVITAWAASVHPTQIRAACVCFCVSVIECFFQFYSGLHIISCFKAA